MLGSSKPDLPRPLGRSPSFEDISNASDLCMLQIGTPLTAIEDPIDVTPMLQCNKCASTLGLNVSNDWNEV